jgi:flagellar motility protein MotE (MotC chaperone)
MSRLSVQKAGVFAGVALALVLWHTLPVTAEDAAPVIAPTQPGTTTALPTPSSPSQVAPAEAAASPDPALDNAAQYCRSIANPAADARYARQVDALTALGKDIDARIAALEKKRAEYEEWVARRQDFLSKADESVVAIYSQMRPDAASQQIAIMDAEAAAAILSKLSPRTASAILNEMDPTTAAHLTNVMAGMPATRRTDAKS